MSNKLVFKLGDNINEATKDIPEKAVSSISTVDMKGIFESEDNIC